MLIFVNAMKKAFEISGENQSTIAIKSGISKTNLSKYMNGKTEPGLAIVSKIANCFGLDIVDFLALGRGDEPAQAIKIEKEVKKGDTDWKERYYEESEAHKNTLLELNQVRKELNQARKELDKTRKDLAELSQIPTASGMETAISISLAE